MHVGNLFYFADSGRRVLRNVHGKMSATISVVATNLRRLIVFTASSRSKVQRQVLLQRHKRIDTYATRRTKQAMRLLGNSTFNAPSAALILMPRSVGYRSLAHLDSHGICAVSAPSILQTATRVCSGDRIPKAMGALESVTSDNPSG